MADETPIFLKNIIYLKTRVRQRRLINFNADIFHNLLAAYYWQVTATFQSQSECAVFMWKTFSQCRLLIKMQGPSKWCYLEERVFFKTPNLVSACRGSSLMWRREENFYTTQTKIMVEMIQWTLRRSPIGHAVIKHTKGKHERVDPENGIISILIWQWLVEF